jgi:hypothetical protein
MGRVIELFVDQFLAIDQGIPETNPEGVYVVQTIAFTDTAKNYRSWHEAKNRLNLGQDVTIRLSIFHITVSQFLPFYQKGSDGPDVQEITQFFGMTQEAKVVEFEELAQTVTFTQSVEVTVAKNAVNTITFTDVASYNIIKNLTVIHTIVIGSASSGYIFSEDFYSIELPTLAGPNAPEFP